MGNEILQEHIEENLENLWIREIEKKESGIIPSSVPFHDTATIGQMVDQGLIIITDDRVKLTETGREEAKDDIRRHRLSERLFADLFGVANDIHNRACKMEHLLVEGVEDKVCTLLGHPRKCPHGTAIPEGKCCISAREEGSKKVITLSDLPIGMPAKIIYVMSDESKEINKIVSMGVEPGVDVVLERRFPSYIFVIGNSRFAVDETIADSIFLRPQPAPPA